MNDILTAMRVVLIAAGIYAVLLKVSPEQTEQWKRNFYKNYGNSEQIKQGNTPSLSNSSPKATGTRLKPHEF